jgi:outer membrane protein OmpA-like peptidoglycan-associated protein
MVTLHASLSGPNSRLAPVFSMGKGRSACLLVAALLLLTGLAGCKKKTPNPEATPSSSSSESGSPSSGTPTASKDTHISDSSEQALGKDQGGSLADRLNAIQSGEADKPGNRPPPDLKPYPAGVTAPEIPLIPHVLLNGTISPAGKEEDDDHATEIMAVDATKVSILVDKDRGPDTDANGKPRKKRPGCTVILDKADIAKGNNYRPFVCLHDPDHIAGTNSMTASVELFKQLKAGQPVEWHFNSDTEQAGDLSMVMQMTGKSDAPVMTTRNGVSMYGCTLQRVESYDLAWPIMLNDKPVDVPVVHAMCKFQDGDEAHFYFLDQADAPWIMCAQLGVIPEVMGVLQVNLPPADQIAAAKKEESEMEKQLEDKKPVEIYGIYFDTNSAVIKPRSEAVLKQIAEIMQKNPGWKLNVSGHTDNIGADAANQVLSEQRAAAVKDALVTRYKIGADRLATSGHGASQPVASNDTMIGRAKNRRVELQRQ